MTGHNKNLNAMTHGIYSFDKGQGIRSLEPAQVENLQDLRNLVKTGDGRLEIRQEIIARLMLISQKFFSDLFETHKNPRFWESGVIKRGGTYLAELRRWIDAYPDDQKGSTTVIDLLRGDDSDDPD